MPASTTTTTRAVKAAETRLRILDSARRVLAAEGVERFTTRRVAELARVSHGMVHYHFKDKRDLMLALVVHARRDWVEPLEELVDGPGTAEERMRAVIAWMARPATTEVMRVHFALYQSGMRDEVVRKRVAAEYARWRDPFVTLFRELADELGIAGLDARSLGEAFATAADGLVQQQSFDPSLATDRILTQLFERLVRPDGLAQPRKRRQGSKTPRGRRCCAT